MCVCVCLSLYFRIRIHAFRILGFGVAIIGVNCRGLLSFYLHFFIRTRSEFWQLPLRLRYMVGEPWVTLIRLVQKELPFVGRIGL